MSDRRSLAAAIAIAGRRHHGGAGVSLIVLAIAASLATGAPHADTTRGEVRPDSLRSSALGVQKRLLVYLPPSYHREPARRYPVAYYLHGAWGAEGDWVTQGRIDRTMDSLVAGGLPEMILVLPTATTAGIRRGTRSTHCRLPRRHRAARARIDVRVPWRIDEYIARELVAHIDSRTAPWRGGTTAASRD